MSKVLVTLDKMKALLQAENRTIYLQKKIALNRKKSEPQSGCSEHPARDTCITVMVCRVNFALLFRAFVLMPCYCSCYIFTPKSGS